MAVSWWQGQRVKRAGADFQLSVPSCSEVAVRKSWPGPFLDEATVVFRRHTTPQTLAELEVDLTKETANMEK